MRAVLDTNVLISGLLWRGPPHILLERARGGDWTMVTSAILLDELARVIRRRKFRAILLSSRSDPDRLVRNLRSLAVIVEPSTLPGSVSRDAADDVVLATAIAARADLIVTGDDDLLALRSYNSIPIVDPAAALRRLR